MTGKSRSKSTKSTKSKSSRRWLDRQHSDYYTQLAREKGYRSRSAYKLLEIQEKDKIIFKGMRVVDLGAAPGGWSQVLVNHVGSSGKIVAIDILPIESLKGVDTVYGDFQKTETLEELMLILDGKSVDLVISDLAPNLSGIAVADQARVMDLAEMALDFAERVLVKEGVFLIKVFQGSGFQEYLMHLKKKFERVCVRKPKASRAESREVYLLATGYHPYSKETQGVCLERHA
ncbi:MAG TPA: RlmE family RNA methyltransferase [Gammaproteobacteria bacterium]|nr:RlmE family RNA methyltransferase [Gammaproteobacteria bacterium]